MIVASKLDLSRASTQDVFDFIVLALIQQGKPARTGQSCQYRANDGCRCAAGHIIADEEYNRRIEGKTIGAAIECRDANEESGKLVLIPSLDRWLTSAGDSQAQALRLSFLHQIQAAHDQRDEDSFGRTDAEWLAKFRVLARGVAESYKLDHSILRYRVPVELPPAVQAGIALAGTCGIGPDDEVAVATL